MKLDVVTWQENFVQVNVYYQTLNVKSVTQKREVHCEFATMLSP